MIPEVAVTDKNLGFFLSTAFDLLLNLIALDLSFSMYKMETMLPHSTLALRFLIILQFEMCFHILSWKMKYC